MPQTFYRRRSKFKHEDWTEEIEKWERIYQEQWYIDLQKDKLRYEQQEKEHEERRKWTFPIFLWKKEEEKKELLLDCDGNYCGHKKKGEMDDGMIVCWKCGRILGRHIGGSVGYHFKNHTMRGRRK